MKRLSFALCAAMLVTNLALARHNPVQPANRSTADWPVNDFALTDDHDQPFTQAQLRGR